jgi:hypothetical protein
MWMNGERAMARRRIRNPVWVLLAVVAGCASSTGGAGGGAEGRSPGAPLRILLEPRQGGWTVDVNDDVQVAIFEILPSIGAGMAYPTSVSRATRLEPGRHALKTGTGILRRHRRNYLERVSGPLGGPPLPSVTATSRPLAVAVACACELDLSAVARPDGLRKLVGPFASLSAPRAVPAILESILPDGQPEYATVRWFSP